MTTYRIQFTQERTDPPVLDPLGWIHVREESPDAAVRKALKERLRQEDLAVLAMLESEGFWAWFAEKGTLPGPDSWGMVRPLNPPRAADRRRERAALRCEKKPEGIPPRPLERTHSRCPEETQPSQRTAVFPPEGLWNAASSRTKMIATPTGPAPVLDTGVPW